MIKNAFYSVLISLLVLEILTFCPDFLVMQKNGPVRMQSLISKFMTSQTGQQIIPIHILSNMSRRKCNQNMKFGQLIEYSMMDIFLKKSYTKCSGESSHRLFYIKSKLSISLDH